MLKNLDCNKAKDVFASSNVDKLVESISKRLILLGEKKEAGCFYNLPLLLTESKTGTLESYKYTFIEYNSDFDGIDHLVQVRSSQNLDIAFRFEAKNVARVSVGLVTSNQLPETRQNLENILRKYCLFHFYFEGLR